MCATRVLQGPVMVTSVEEHTLDLPQWDTMASVMGWVREMPVAADIRTPVVGVMHVVTEGSHSVSGTGFAKVVIVHVAMHSHTFHLHPAIHKVLPARRPPHTEGVHVTVVAIGPAMRVACVLQGTTAMATRVEECADCCPHIDPMVTIVMGVRQVPAAMCIHASSVIVCRMIADRPESLGLACFADVVPVHPTTDKNTLHLVMLVLQCAESLRLLNTGSLAILVASVHPPM